VPQRGFRTQPRVLNPGNPTQGYAP
jgi:hypothetical protein